METTERVVEAYVRYVKGWATIPNIRCGGQLEVDLLAIDMKTGERYHIETSVSVSAEFSKLTGKPFSREALKDAVGGPSQTRTIGYFAERKFGDKNVRDKLQEYGFEEFHYKKIIVSWGWTREAEVEAERAKIELWDFRRIILELAERHKKERAYFMDDTVRTLHLLSLAQSRSP
jgi:hypothetical protein